MFMPVTLITIVSLLSVCHILRTVRNIINLVGFQSLIDYQYKICSMFYKCCIKVTKLSCMIIFTFHDRTAIDIHDAYVLNSSMLPHRGIRPSGSFRKIDVRTLQDFSQKKTRFHRTH